MTVSFAMPDVGEGLTEAEIVAWHVSVGDEITVNQVIVEIETAKAVVELPSPYAGTVTELRCAPGEVVPIGVPIMVIAERTGPAGPSPAPAGPAQPQPAGDSAVAAASPAQQPVLVGYGVRHTEVRRRPRRPPPVLPAAGSAPRMLPEPGRPAARPPVRKVARDLGIDLSTVIPTGPQGEVTRADILAASAAAVSPDSASPRPGAPEEIRTPVTGARKRIADAMVASAFSAPHVTEWLTVDVTRTLRLLDQLRAETPATRVTPLTLLARATLLSIGRHPQINARWDDPAHEIVQFRDVNLGLAVASPRGLIVPNIPAAQALPFGELAAAMNVLIQEARANRTAPERMRGGTFTITNIGVFGVDGATPIINPGESAILAFGQIQQRPWAHKRQAALRPLTTLSLSFDHRLIDGKIASEFLTDVGALLERPGRALAW